MERELSEFDFQIVIRFEFLDTPGDEVAPGSNEIGKDFKNEWISHGRLLFSFVQIVQGVQNVQRVHVIQLQRFQNIQCLIVWSLSAGSQRVYSVSKRQGKAARKLTLR